MPSDYDLEGPAMERPDGVGPHWSDSHGQPAVGYSIVIIGIIIATFSIIVRFASRAMIKRYGAADFFMFAAWGLYLAFQAILLKCTISPGILRHQWNLKLKDLPNFGYQLYIERLLYEVCMLCLKLAILIDWLHLFVPTRQRGGFWLATHILIWINVIFYFVCVLLNLIQCTPIEKIWNPLYEGGACRIDDLQNNISIFINLVSDLAILILPQWKIWRLQMSRQKKLGVSVVFTIGILATLLGALRLIPLVPLSKSEDGSYWWSLLGLFSSAEVGVGFLILGLPCVPKVFSGFSLVKPCIKLVRSIGSSVGARGQNDSRILSDNSMRQESSELEETELRYQSLESISNTDSGHRLHVR